MNDERQQRSVVVGALLGAAAGGLAVLFLRRWARTRRSERTEPIKPEQWVRFGVALMPAIRQLVDFWL